jgi:hypothetical protein
MLDFECEAKKKEKERYSQIWLNPPRNDHRFG